MNHLNTKFALHGNAKMTVQLLQTMCGFLLILSVCGTPFQKWPIGLTSGGYNNILIAINERVDETHRTEILNKIEEYMTDLSQAMYQATKNKLFIRNVTILVPQSWNGSYTAAGREAFQYANILIDEANPAIGDTPYVARSLPECGKPGDYMHLTPEYLKQGFRKLYGQPGNVLLHEWAHLRWGLGDEYPHRELGEEAFYFADSPFWGHYGAPVKCSSGIKGLLHTFENNKPMKPGCEKDPNTGLPNDECYFIPFQPDEGQTARASFMYDQGIESVSEFCDDVQDEEIKHNADAPNEQNRLCDGKSAWAVFNEQPDFQGPSLSLELSQLIPEFTFVQRTLSDRIVLVLDVSGSMGAQDHGAPASRIERLGSDASQYITNVIGDGTYVGIVKFNSGASLVKPLTLIDNDRHDLANSVHFSAGGGTCIGCGILTAIEVLESMGNAAGGNIIVISDGQDGNSGKLAEAEAAIQNLGVVLDAILYTVNADEVLRDLAKQSSGKIYFEEGGSTDLIQALIESEVDRKSGSSSVPVQLYLDNVIIQALSSKNVTFYMDMSVGMGTKVTFTYQSGVTKDYVELTLHSPGGYVATNATSDAMARTISLEIMNIAEPGEWVLEITNMAAVNMLSQVLVLSNQVDTTADPITAKAFVSDEQVNFMDRTSLFMRIVAEVKRGYASVVDATVIASVRSIASGQTTEVPLRDIGIGADIIKSDGYYTGLFVSYSQDGKYSVKVKVSNNEGLAKVLTGGVTGAYIHPDLNDTSTFVRNVTSENLGGFDRSTSGGFFTVENYRDDDMFPPAQISDLSLKAMSYNNNTIQLEWTAMGEDYDQNGPASGYSLRYCEASKKLRDDFGNCTEVKDDDLTEGSITVAAEPYTRESVTILLPGESRNITYYFAVKAVDHNGQWSPLSNVVSAGIYYIPPYIEPTTEGIKTTTQEMLMETTTEQTVSTLPESTVKGTLSTSPATPNSYRTTESPDAASREYTTESDTTNLGVAKSGLTRNDITIIGSSAGALLLVVIVTVSVTAYCFKLSKQQRPLYSTDFSDVERMYQFNTSDLSRGLKTPRPGVVGLNHGHAMNDSMSDRGMDRGYGNNGFAPHGNRLPRNY